MISELGRSLAAIAWHFGPKGLNGQCCDDLSMPEFIALDKVSSIRSCSVQEVGCCLGFTKSGATRVVNRLEKKGYIQKMKSEDDGRFCCVVITEKGQETLRKADLRFAQQFKELISKMPHGYEEKVRQILSDMARTMSS